MAERENLLDSRDQTLASVIIPAYNVEPYLSATIDSILQQTYANLEIIVVDDGSTDGTGEIADAYAQKDSRVSVIHQGNQGVSCARNRALSVMQGEIVFFLDSDDIAEPDFVLSMVTAMVQENADLVACRYREISETGEFCSPTEVFPSADKGTYTREEALRALSSGEMEVNVWNKCYRRELWDTIRFPQGHIHEDDITAFRIFDLCHKVIVLDQPLYRYRLRRGSIMQTVTWKKIKDKKWALSSVRAFMEERTPAVFTKQEIENIRSADLAYTILMYFRIVSGSFPDADLTEEEVRAMILKEMNTAGTARRSIGVTLACNMIRYCPAVITLIYPVYASIQRLGKRG